MSIMLSHYPSSPSQLLRSSAPASPSPRRVRSNPPQSRPSALSMSNMQVNASAQPGLLSLSRPSSQSANSRSRGGAQQQAKKGGEQLKSDQLPRLSQPKLASLSNDSTSKPSPSKPTTAAPISSEPYSTQVQTPGKQQRRTRRPKRSNSDPLFPNPSSPPKEQLTANNPPRTPAGPSSASTPSGKASSPTLDQSLPTSAVPNTPTPASKSGRGRGGGGGRRNNDKTSAPLLVAEPKSIPFAHAPPEADPDEHLSHSAPSESSFMMASPEPVASGDGKRARGRSGKASKKKEHSGGGSGREDSGAFVLDEEEGKVWDMPEKKGTDQLTWQQSLAASSAPQFNSLASPSANHRSSPNPRNARVNNTLLLPLPAQTASQHRHTASLTWQQALLPSLPAPSLPQVNSAPPTLRRRNSLSMSGLSLSGPSSATTSRLEEHSSRHQRQSILPVLTTPTKTTAIMPKEDVQAGRVGPRYAGGTFQNSPMAGDLPKPRFGGRA